MPHFTRSGRPPHTHRTPAREGPPPDGTLPVQRTAPDTAESDPDRAAAGPRDARPAAARVAARTLTVTAALLVLGALLLPDEPDGLTPGAFVRLPVEVICGAAVLLMLPPRARRIAAVAAGPVLGLLTLLKLLDIGFHTVLDRPFDLVLDWILLDDAQDFLRDSIGRTAATGVAIGAVLGAAALLVLMTLALRRLSRVLDRHGAAAAGGTLALGTAWITCLALGVQIAGTPLAARSEADFVQARADRVRAGIADERAFATEAAGDAFRDTPPERLLTELRGKDVLFTFIESYGRSAVQDPSMAPQVGAVLADGTRRLRKAGFAARSAFLTSPTAGGGSWLAHSTFLSGLWIKNQQRYRSVTSSDRLTLTGAFRRAGAWRTSGIMPGVTRSWPEGRFYGLDHVYDTHQLGYRGPKFSWSRVPDQYSLAAFERLEHGRPHRGPLMSEIILVSSHNPWAPIPRTVGWDEIGDGSVYDAIEKAGKDPEEVWRDPTEVRTEYRRSIEYSLRSLISYLEKYGDKNTVLVFLGDHQPVPTVTGGRASHDVPISIVAHDRAVLDRIAGWGWQDGLKPGPKAPVWRMDTFRDRFLTAYGSRPGAAANPAVREGQPFG